MAKLKALLIIYTYNERENVTFLINDILNLGEEIKILVVDDDSPDGTWEIVKKLKEKNDRVELLRRKGVRGRGLASIEGIKLALKEKTDCIIEMDADFSHSPHDISKLLGAINDYDVILGSRFLQGGTDVERSFTRRWMSKAAAWYVRSLLKLKIRDVNSGFRCFKRETLRCIELDKIFSKGPAIVPEILSKAVLIGFKVKEVPIVFHRRKNGKSKLNLLILIRWFIDIFMIKLYRLTY